MKLKIPTLSSLRHSRSRSRGADSHSQRAESLPSSSQDADVATLQNTPSPGVSPPAVIERNELETQNIPRPVASGGSLWAKAYHRLLDNEKNTLAAFSVNEQIGLDRKPEEIIRAIQDKREICDDKQWRFRLGARTVRLTDLTDKVLNWLDRFKAIGDIAVNADPIHAGLPWAGIRFLLQAVTAERDQMEALFKGLNRVFYIVYRCQLYELLLQSESGLSQASENLRSALVDFYTVILQFLAKATHLHKQNLVQRVLTAWSSKGIESFEGQCISFEHRAETEAQNFHRTAISQKFSQIYDLLNGLPKMKDLKDTIEHVDFVATATWAHLQEKEAIEILKWISRIPYKDHHKNACTGRTANTGGWIFQHKTYVKWQSSKNPEILWLNGIPGAGKTKLVSRVIDHITDNEPETMLAYFYCNRNDESRRIALNVLQSYVQQLSKSPRTENNAVQRSLVEIYKQNRIGGGESAQLSIEECERLLQQLISGYPQVTLVLDALDESPVDEREDLLKALDRIVQESVNLKVFISSRRNDDIKLRLEGEANLSIEATDNEDDISKFVSEKIEQMQESRRTPISDGMKEKIVSTLLEKSQGMFQWVVLQIDQILHLNLEKDIQERLGRLPIGLKKAYDEIFDNIELSDGSNAKIARRAFQYLLFSFNPLQSEALVAFVSRNPDTGMVEHHDLNINIVLDACCNLMVVQRIGRWPSVEEICFFSHLSVREYIDEHYQPISKPVLAHHNLATITISSLLENNTDRDRNKYSRMSSLRYAAQYWPRHTRHAFDSPSSEILCSLVNQLFDKQFGKAYVNWLRIYNPDNEIFSGGGYFDCVVPLRRGEVPGQLYYTSLLNFPSAVEKLVKEGAQVVRGGVLRSALVAAAVKCHRAVFIQLMNTSPPINAEDLLCVVAKIDGDMEDITTILEALGVLCLDGETQSRGHRAFETSELRRYLKAAAGNKNCGDRLITFLLEGYIGESPIGEDVLEAAVGNESRALEVVTILLDKYSADIHITVGVAEAAARDPRGFRNPGKQPDQVMMALIDRCDVDRSVTLDVVAKILEGFGGNVVARLLEKHGTDINITEDLMKAAALNLSRDQPMALLLDRGGAEIIITEDVVRTASRWSNGVMAVLLERRGADIPLTSDIVCGIAQNSSEKTMADLLNKRGLEITITEDILLAAARNYAGSEMMKVLLDKFKGAAVITEELVIAAAQLGEEGAEFIGLLFDECGSDVPVTDEVVEAVVLNDATGAVEVMRVLISHRRNDIKIGEELMKAAVESGRLEGAEVIKVLFDEYGTAIPMTEGVLKAALQSDEFAAPDVMRVLLNRRGMDITITEEAIALVVQNKGPRTGELIKVLFDKRGIEIPITEEVMKLAVQNEGPGTAGMIKVLFDEHRIEIPISEEVMKLVVQNKGVRTGELIKVLFDERGIEIPITEEVMKLAVQNQSWAAAEIVRVLFDERGMEIPITEEVMKLAVQNQSWAAAEIVRVLFDERGIEIPITEEVMKLAVQNQCRGAAEMKKVLFEERGLDLPITEEVVKLGVEITLTGQK